MSLVIVGMIATLLGVVFYLRWRAAHPLPEPDSVRTVVGDGKSQSATPPSRLAASSETSSWEKPEDWWKPGAEDGDDDEAAC